MTSPRYLLDTDICIYLRKRRPPALLRKFAALAPGEAAISVITHGELQYGACKREDPAASLRVLAEFVALIPALPMPAEAGHAYGRIRAALERQGETIGNNDLWIAAHAVAAGLVLVTNNLREFRRVPGLMVEDWVSAV